MDWDKEVIEGSIVVPSENTATGKITLWQQGTNHLEGSLTVAYGNEQDVEGRIRTPYENTAVGKASFTGYQNVDVIGSIQPKPSKDLVSSFIVIIKCQVRLQCLGLVGAIL